MGKPTATVSALTALLTLAAPSGCGSDDGAPAGARIAVKIQGDSDYQYPLPEPVHYPLGSIPGRDITLPLSMGGGRGKSYVWPFEVSFAAGSAACPNHVHQFKRDTVSYADGSGETAPPARAGDPGGFESERWSPDPAPDGINPVTQPNPGGVISYVDAPGLIVPQPPPPGKLPATKRTTYRWVLHDCSERMLDREDATLTLTITATGSGSPALTPPTPSS
jgi:hypothetical protein